MNALMKLGTKHIQDMQLSPESIQYQMIGSICSVKSHKKVSEVHVGTEP